MTEIKGITESKLADIKTSYAQNRTLRDVIALLAPFHLTPKMAAKIYRELGPACVDILHKSPFGLCRISGIGFRRVDAIALKTGCQPHDPMRIQGAVNCALDEARSKNGHLFLPREELIGESLKLLNEKLPVPQLRLCREEVETVLEEMAAEGQTILSRDDIYPANVFSQEDETAYAIASLLSQKMPVEDISACLDKAKVQVGLTLSEKQEAAVQAAFHNPVSIITGSPGTGKTTVLKMVLEVYKALHPDKEIRLVAPTGRAGRRMAESTGFSDAKTMHSALGLLSGEDGDTRTDREKPLDAGLIVADEFSMVDMWLAKQFFPRIKQGTRLVLVGDPDQLPSVSAGNVFRELIACGRIPVTVLDRLFRQAGDSLIAYNAKFINEGTTKLYYGNDFIFLNAETQEDAARILREQYCKEISEHGISQVQILSPFRMDGAAGVNALNAVLREIVNPFHSQEDEITVGTKHFRAGDRIMQTRNTKHASNGDLGFIRFVRETPDGKEIGMDFGDGRESVYRPEDLVDLDFAYAATIHKAMGSECDVILMPLIRAHTIMLYRNLLYTAITRARKKVILVGQRSVLFMAIHRSNISRRNTRLGERIINYCRSFAPVRRSGAIGLAPDKWQKAG